MLQHESLLWSLLHNHWVMCLATGGSDGPRTAPLFYALAEASRDLLFLSNPASRHCQDTAGDSRAAAAVYFESRSISELRGVQLTGRVRCLSGIAAERQLSRYFEVHPEAKKFYKNEVFKLFGFRILGAKLTDNREGFGHKLEWTFPEAQNPLGTTRQPI